MKIISFVRKFFFLINILFSLYSLLVYQLVFTVNIKHWTAGFLMLTFPVVILIHILFCLFWIFGRSSKFLLSFILLLISFKILNRTFKFPNKNIGKTKDEFSVLSYNLMYSDFSNWKEKQEPDTGMALVNTQDTLTADIKCFQEFYNTDEYPDFQMIKKLKKKWPYYVYMHSTKESNNGQTDIGLATFSRFPIVNKKEVYWKPNNNGMLASDIKIKNDTIRVINVQLKSMGIRVSKIITKDRKFNEQETKSIFLKLKEGFMDRSIEVNLLEDWILESPYPVILVGDFNEMPYGYAYGRVRKLLQNAFENTGLGFGFTYHKILSFLRIDNQFYNANKIENVGFKTFSDTPYSDHYPILGRYVIYKK